MPRVVLAVLAAAVWTFSAMAEEPAAPRQKELLYLLEQDCGSCHGRAR